MKLDEAIEILRHPPSVQKPFEVIDFFDAVKLGI